MKASRNQVLIVTCLARIITDVPSIIASGSVLPKEGEFFGSIDNNESEASFSLSSKHKCKKIKGKPFTIF